MDDSKLAEERTDLAEDRTIWADQRTYLAQQRTFGGWVRTGLTSMAVGFGAIEFLGRDRPTWIVMGIGLIFIVLGAVIPVLALISYRNVELHMKKSKLPGGSFAISWVVAIAASLVLAAIGGIVLVFS